MTKNTMNDLNQTNTYEQNNNEKRTVPYNLFPLNEKDINEDWAKKTYSKSHLFNSSFRPIAWATERDILAWMTLAKSLVKDIKWEGVTAGRDRIVELAVHRYNLKLPQGSDDFPSETLSPVNLNDVVEIVSNPKWYNHNKSTKQAIVHELIYGITRKVNNFWLIDAEKKWLLRHNISYQDKDCKRITETRGFVYKLMNSIFSNTTIKMFKRAMISRLGEYISVRDNAHLNKKNSAGEESNYSIVSRNFPTGKGYVITRKEFKMERNNIESQEMLHHLLEWIKQCVKNNTSISQVMTIVRDMYCKEYTREINQAQSLYSKCNNFFHNESLHNVDQIEQQHYSNSIGKYSKYIFSFLLINLFFPPMNNFEFFFE